MPIGYSTFCFPCFIDKKKSAFLFFIDKKKAE